MTQPLVTICVPTFRAETTLAESLESILAQSYSNVQVKIFDNASDDRTVEIARRFEARDARVSVLVNASNLGGEGNFTRCLQAAEGEYTGIFHSDDLYSPQMIERQVNVLEEHKELSAVATHAFTIDAEGGELGERFLPFEFRAEALSTVGFDRMVKLTFAYGNFITCPSVMARSQIYRDTIRVWDGARYKTSADLDVWLRLARLGPIGVITEPLMKYRVSQASFSVRETKRRLDPHDLFLVLDALKDDEYARSFLGAREYDGYEFLRFKDLALRSLNTLLARGYPPEYPRWNVSWPAVLRGGLRSPFHMKFLAAGLGIALARLVTPTPLRRALSAGKPRG